MGKFLENFPANLIKYFSVISVPFGYFLIDFLIACSIKEFV